jgi:hypothetical protein
MKFAFQCVQLCILFQSLSAFCTPNLPRSHDTSRMMSRDDEVFVRDSFRAFGVAATIFAFGFMNAPAPAAAANQAQNHVFSTSIQVSETIKTMDFSLPSSYGAISDAKASGVEKLSREENILTGIEVKKAPKAKSSSSDSFSLGGKQLSPEEKAALAAERQAEREAIAAEKQALEAEKQVEKEATAAAKRTEKEAMEVERAAQKATADAEKGEKIKEAKEAKAKAEAAKAEKDSQKASEANFAGAEFVDMGLPSYGDATATKGKGAFSI